MSPSTAAPLAPTPIPQVITIDTPPGTPVGSPVVITGRTARWPKNGLLVYRIVNGAGQQLGAGSFPVFGTPGQAGSFNASLVFNVPWDGGPIRVDLFEQGDAAGAGAASASIDLAVEAQYQAITIDTPPPGTIVGSPMVITGRTARAPRDIALVPLASSARPCAGRDLV